MVIHEFSLHWTRSHNLVDGPRMRDQSIRISERRLFWRVQKERQEGVAREAGRIGYIGNQGPALGTSTMPSH
jgi:hypothetical protein